jgi:hypothetical protein
LTVATADHPRGVFRDGCIHRRLPALSVVDVERGLGAREEMVPATTALFSVLNNAIE